MLHKSWFYRLVSLALAVVVAFTLQAAFATSRVVMAADQSLSQDVLVTLKASSLYAPSPEMQRSWEASAARWTAIGEHFLAAANAAGGNARAWEAEAERWTKMGEYYAQLQR